MHSGNVDVPESSDKQNTSIFESLINWIVDDKQSLSVVENVMSKRLFQHLNSIFCVCPSFTIGLEAKHSYTVVGLHFMKIISHIPQNVALTFDVYWSRVMRGHFLVTVHWININWKQVSAVLDFKDFPVSSNMHTTCTMLIQMMKEFSLITKLSKIATDSCSKIPPAMRIVRQFLNENLN